MPDVADYPEFPNETALSSTVVFTAGSPAAGADPTTVEAHIVEPGGAVTVRTYAAAEVERLGVGVYRVTFTPTTPGAWAVRWEGHGAVEAASDTRFVVLEPAA